MQSTLRVHDWQCNKCDFASEDRISRLPNEILVMILSRLPLMKAVSCSILSTRWRHLWTLTTRLNFDRTKSFKRIMLKPELHRMARQNFVLWVNQFLGLHEAGTIEEFKVCFCLGKRFNLDIDEWIKFALSRKVQKLELDPSLALSANKDYYTFRLELFGQCEKTCLSSRFDTANANPILVGVGSLKDVCLKNVHVGDEVVEFLQSNCPALERLTIHFSSALINLKVGGPNCAMKYLELRCCFSIKSIEISDAPLVSFSYFGHHPKLLIKNVPSLVNLSIGGTIVDAYFGFLLNDTFAQHWCCLKTLTLQLDDCWLLPDSHSLPHLTTLEQLILKSTVFDDCPFGRYSYLIDICPRLQKFEFQAAWSENLIVSKRVPKVITKKPHQCLKEVKLGGYYGRKSDLEFALCFLETAVALEKMVIDPRNQSQFVKKSHDTRRQRIARSRAKQQLEGVVPAGVKLVIL